MKMFTIKLSDIAACPTHSLLPAHYRDDGSCEHVDPVNSHYSAHVDHDVSYSERGWQLWEVKWTDGEPELVQAVDFSGVEDVQLWCRDCAIALEGIDL